MLQVLYLLIIPLKHTAMKVQFLTDHLYILTTFSQYVDSNHKWSIKISTFIATIYLKGLLIRKGLLVNTFRNELIYS